MKAKSPPTPHITLSSPGSPYEIATHREGRAGSIHQVIGTTSEAAKQRMSISRSPVRTPITSSAQSQRLRQPAVSQPRRPSLTVSAAAFDGSADSSSTLGTPYYAYQHTASTGSVSPGSTGSSSARHAVLNSTVPVSTRSSPRNSFSSLDTNYTSHSAQLRRHSESIQRRPSTAEVFDLMEREQDAIVLKLTREIQQLKEDNRALLQTINLLTNPSSHNQTPALRTARSRRSSSVTYPEDVLDLSRVSLRSASMPRSMVLESRTSAYLGVDEEGEPKRPKAKEIGLK